MVRLARFDLRQKCFQKNLQFFKAIIKNFFKVEISGYMFLCGCVGVGVWVCGCVGVWVCGCVGVGV